MCSGRVASTIAVVVDASGSMASMKRMSVAKGLVLKLLQDAYVNKDRVSMVVFRDSTAEVVVPPTSSPHFAISKIAEMKTGGKTPLTAGLIKARDVLRAEMKKGYVPIMVLITDGRANVAFSRDIEREIEKVCESILRDRILTVVFDADDYVSLGYSKEISEMTGGLYYRLSDFSEGRVFEIVDGVRRSFSS
nr:VWA domain-containing protein [Archaeoglobus neptunius]